MSRYPVNNAAPDGASKPDEIHDAIDRVADIGESVVGGLEKIFGGGKKKPATIEASTAPRIEASEHRQKTLRRAFVVPPTPPELAFMRELNKRGGEMPWDWSHPRLNENAKAMVANLINSQFVKEQERVTHAMQLEGRLYLVLTDLGRGVLEQLDAAPVKRLTATTP